MFTLNHFIWLAICAVLIVTATVLLRKYRPSLQKVLTVALLICVASEFVKVFASVEMVSYADGTKFYPYLKLGHLPFHLCSLQIVTITCARFMKPSGKKDALLAFMYPTCLIGAFFALLLPSIFSSGTCSVQEAFFNPMAYQYFLYHVMLIVLGIYIGTCGQVKITPKHYFTTLALLAVVAFCSIYLNSMFADVTYENGKLISVNYVPNLVFTVKPPIDAIKLTEVWHWYLYLAVIFVLAVGLIAVFWIPFFLKAKKEKQAKAESAENQEEKI